MGQGGVCNVASTFVLEETLQTLELQTITRGCRLVGGKEMDRVLIPIEANEVVAFKLTLDGKQHCTQDPYPDIQQQGWKVGMDQTIEEGDALVPRGEDVRRRTFFLLTPKVQSVLKTVLGKWATPTYDIVDPRNARHMATTQTSHAYSRGLSDAVGKTATPYGKPTMRKS